MKKKYMKYANSIALLIAAVFILYASNLVQAADIMQLDDIKSGMKGIGRTAIQGNQLIEFQVEIISVLKNFTPKKNMIIAKLSGGPIEKIGIAAGMSGSPVYINGKLIGAVAYAFPFASEAIGGITPIEEMTGIPENKPAEVKKSSSISSHILEYLLNVQDTSSAEKYYSRFLDIFPINFQRTASSPYIQVPLVMNMFSRPAFPVLQQWWEKNGFIPVMAGSVAGDKEVQELKEGSAVAVSFVTGDVDMGAVGTVTYIDKNRLFAFGHTLFNLGDVSLPMAYAEVNAVVPNLYNSFKIASIGKTFGTFKQDLPSSIFGYINENPPVVPMKIKMTYNKQENKYNYLMASHHLLGPVIANYVLSQTLASTDSSAYEGTLNVKGTITMEGHNPVNIDNVYSGFLNIPEASTFLSAVYAYLVNNEFEETKIKEIDLSATVTTEQKVADLIEVRFDKSEMKKGDTVTFKIIVKPYQKAPVSYDYELKIGDKFNPGSYYVLVGGADALNKFDYAYYYRLTVFENLDQIIKLINTMKRNDTIYIRIFSPKTSLIVKNKLMNDLPPSYFDIIDSPQTSGASNKVMIEHILEESVRSEYVIKGAKRMTIEIKE